MEIDELEIVELELKYCERCGALWLRRSGTTRVYCGVCAPKMLDCPRLRKSGGTRKVRITRDFMGVEQEQGVMLRLEGGQA